MTATNAEEARPDRLLVGVDELAAEANQPRRRMQHWLNSGVIRCAQKRGHLWTASRLKLRRELGLD